MKKLTVGNPDLPTIQMVTVLFIQIDKKPGRILLFLVDLVH
jgi:hypothetical protein